MREIKFRAWNGEEMIFPTSIMQGGTACWRENSVIETSNDVMFYTGFKSKNGEEIYEHDVILLKDKDYDEKNETRKYLMLVLSNFFHHNLYLLIELHRVHIFLRRFYF